MAWMNNPRDMFCANQEEFYSFLDDNYISSYCTCNANSALIIKDVLLTGKNRSKSAEHYHNIFHEENKESLPMDLVKRGIFFRTDDCQIFYTFSTKYSLDKLDDMFSPEFRNEYNLDVKLKDKSENFLLDDCNLVIVSIPKRELPILK